MLTPPKETLIDMMDTSQDVILRQVEGLNHEEALILPTGGGNCMNWVLGRILASRDTCLSLMGMDAELSPAEKAVYDRGCERLTEPELAMPLEELKIRLASSHARLVQKLAGMAQPELERIVVFGRGGEQQLGGVLAFLQWHEAYHTGQLELLRNLAGHTDKLI